MSAPRPRVIQVIESTELRGSGVTDNPFRDVIRYHTLDGELLAERDSWTERRASASSGDTTTERQS